MIKYNEYTAIVKDIKIDETIKLTGLDCVIFWKVKINLLERL